MMETLQKYLWMILVIYLNLLFGFILVWGVFQRDLDLQKVGSAGLGITDTVFVISLAWSHLWKSFP